MTKRAASPAQQLETFITKFTPEVAKIARAAIAKMRVSFRGAHELVYDNYNALAIGWSPTPRTSDVICSLALYPRWVSLFFFLGTKLPDPDERLQGKGSTVRHIVLEAGAATLDQPAVRKLIAHAKKLSTVAVDPKAPGELVIKSISKNQRPRRPR